MSINNGKLINTAEAAAIIGCSTRRVRQLHDEGKIKGEKISPTAIVIDRASAERYAKTPITGPGRPRKPQKAD